MEKRIELGLFKFWSKIDTEMQHVQEARISYLTDQKLRRNNFRVYGASQKVVPFGLIWNLYASTNLQINNRIGRLLGKRMEAA